MTNNDNSNVIINSVCALMCLGMLFIVILIPISLRNVGHSEYGVAYDHLNCLYEREVYTEGKHLVRPSTEMFYYNRIIVTIDLDGDNSVDCLTKDGILVRLAITFQYEIIKEELLMIFMEFGHEVYLREFLKATAVDSIQDTCGIWEAESFYESRGSIELDIMTNLHNDFVLARCHVVGKLLQLKHVWLPLELEAAIVEKQRSEQDIDNALQERAGALIVAQTLLESARVEAETLIITANAEATALITEASELATSVETVYRNRGTYYKAIKESMQSNMTASEFVNDYLHGVVTTVLVNPILQL
jgi:hypothetical protein